MGLGDADDVCWECSGDLMMDRNCGGDEFSQDGGSIQGIEGRKRRICCGFDYLEVTLWQQLKKWIPETEELDGLEILLISHASHQITFRSTQEHMKNVQDAPSSSVILYIFRDGGALACGAKSVGELT